MRALFSNAALWVPLSVAFGVQLYKLLADWVQTGHLNLRVLAQAGGMPSSHSAMVASLATVVGYQNGLDSPIFAVAMVLAVVVMYDARGVRQESGKQARVLNELMRTFLSGHPITDAELKELVGHTTVQVIAGSLIGVIYSLAYLIVRDWL